MCIIQLLSPKNLTYNMKSDNDTSAIFGALLFSDSRAIQQEKHQEGEVAVRKDQHVADPHSENWEVDQIEEVRSYDCLWNTTCRAFRETPKKAEAWRQISAKLNMEG